MTLWDKQIYVTILFKLLLNLSWYLYDNFLLAWQFLNHFSFMNVVCTWLHDLLIFIDIMCVQMIKWQILFMNILYTSDHMTWKLYECTLLQVIIWHKVLWMNCVQVITWHEVLWMNCVEVITWHKVLWMNCTSDHMTWSFMNELYKWSHDMKFYEWTVYKWSHDTKFYEWTVYKWSHDTKFYECTVCK